jgi:hypothetical protein
MLDAVIHATAENRFLPGETNPFSLQNNMLRFFSLITQTELPFCIRFASYIIRIDPVYYGYISRI